MSLASPLPQTAAVLASKTPPPDPATTTPSPQLGQDSSDSALVESGRMRAKSSNARHIRSHSQPIVALGIRDITPQRASSSSPHNHTRNLSTPNALSQSEGNLQNSPQIPDLSPHRLSRYSSRLSFQDSLDSRRPSLDLSRPTPPLVSPSRSNARHSRTLSTGSNASGSARALYYSSEPSVGRGHSRRQSAVSLLSSNSTSISETRNSSLTAPDSSVKSLQPRQYNYPEKDDPDALIMSRPLSVLQDSFSDPTVSTQHSDVRKAPPIVRKPQQTRVPPPPLMQPPASPRGNQRVPGSPLRDQPPQMTSVWLDDNGTRLNRSKSTATKMPRSNTQPAHLGHRKHSSLSSSSPRTPMTQINATSSTSSAHRQSKIGTPSEAATRLASVTATTGTTPSKAQSNAKSPSPQSRTPSSLRKFFGTLSPLRFNTRKSASPQPDPQPQPQQQPTKTKRRSYVSTPQTPKSPSKDRATSSAAATSGNLQAAINFQSPNRNSAKTKPRPHSMVAGSPRAPPNLTASPVPERPARPSPSELLDATDMNRLSQDFSRRSFVYSPTIPQSPGFTGTPSPRLSMVHDKRCFSAVSTLSNESAPSTRTGSRTSLVVDTSLNSRSPRVTMPHEFNENKDAVEETWI